MPSSSSETVRQTIIDFMQSRKLTRKTWCKQAGLSDRTLSHFLNGINDTITLGSLEKLAKAADVPVGVLTGEIPAPQKDKMTTGNSTIALSSSSFELTEDDVHNLQLIVQLLRQQNQRSERIESLLEDIKEGLEAGKDQHADADQEQKGRLRSIRNEKSGT